MIDISRSFIPDYVRAFRDLRASLGVVTCLGNYDRYTGEDTVVRGRPSQQFLVVVLFAEEVDRADDIPAGAAKRLAARLPALARRTR